MIIYIWLLSYYTIEQMNFYQIIFKMDISTKHFNNWRESQKFSSFYTIFIHLISGNNVINEVYPEHATLTKLLLFVK